MKALVIVIFATIIMTGCTTYQQLPEEKIAMNRIQQNTEAIRSDFKELNDLSTCLSDIKTDISDIENITDLL